MIRRTLSASVVLFLIAFLVGTVAHAEDASAPPRPRRSGFTMELGLGGAATLIFDRLSSGGFSSTGEDQWSSYYKTRLYGGIAPLSLGIGGFLTEKVALMFRAAGTNYFRTNDPAAVLFYGAAVQIWASDALMFGAGLGLGAHSTDISLGIDELGVASSLRASYAFFTNATQALGVGLELFPAFFPDSKDITLGTALILEWQLL